MTDDATAAALLERAGLRPSSPAERDALLAAYPACRAMTAEVWSVPVGDTAPLLPAVDG